MECGTFPRKSSTTVAPGAQKMILASPAPCGAITSEAVAHSRTTSGRETPLGSNTTSRFGSPVFASLGAAASSSHRLSAACSSPVIDGTRMIAIVVAQATAHEQGHLWGHPSRHSASTLSPVAQQRGGDLYHGATTTEGATTRRWHDDRRREQRPRVPIRRCEEVAPAEAERVQAWRHRARAVVHYLDGCVGAEEREAEQARVGVRQQIYGGGSAVARFALLQGALGRARVQPADRPVRRPVRSGEHLEATARRGLEPLLRLGACAANVAAPAGDGSRTAAAAREVEERMRRRETGDETVSQH
eukprot:scaffold15780_cov68-Phaeocystis_antarctica.AAC.7